LEIGVFQGVDRFYTNFHVEGMSPINHPSFQ